MANEKARILLLAAGGAALLGVALPGVHARAEASAGRPESGVARAAGHQVVGTQVPDVSAQDYDGKTVGVASVVKGTPTLITFWATWCGPCVKELPVFQRLLDEHAGRFQVVAIAMQDPRDVALAFIKKHAEYKFRFFHDPQWEKSESKLSEVFGIVALPTNVLVDSSGRIVDAWMGALSEAGLAKRVQQILNQGPV
jgi:cytochrome c-type biogenesis protein